MGCRRLLSQKDYLERCLIFRRLRLRRLIRFFLHCEEQRHNPVSSLRSPLPAPSRPEKSRGRHRSGSGSGSGGVRGTGAARAARPRRAP